MSTLGIILLAVYGVGCLVAYRPIAREMHGTESMYGGRVTAPNAAWKAAFVMLFWPGLLAMLAIGGVCVAIEWSYKHSAAGMEKLAGIKEPPHLLIPSEDLREKERQ